MLKECEHEFYFRMPYAPESMDGTYVHVYIEGYCDKCGMELITDYSWDALSGEVVTEPNEEYECDECGADMGDDPIITDDEYDAHFCCRKCQAEYRGEELDEEEE